MIKQPILVELQYFVNAVANIQRGIGPEITDQLVKCSLTIFQDLPAARDAVLEYFALVFDKSLGNYISFIEKDANGAPPVEPAIVDIQEALEKLVSSGTPAWAPLLSTWSLKLLGQLSEKHGRGRDSMNITATCNFWMNSSAMKALLGLSASCFAKLNNDESESCIGILLATFVSHTPHFDWVVARLGGCFPLKVISKILQCGLKAFSGNFNNTLDSEVGILGYLSMAHERDLNIALREMFEAVLYPKTQGSLTPNLHTIPYLIHLSRMSEILLQPIINVFLDTFKETLIPNLVYQSMHFPSNYNVREIFILLTDLATQVGHNGIRVILTLARMAETYSWCHELLEHILLKLEMNVLDDRKCPLLTNLTNEASQKILWASCRSDNAVEHQTVVRLILLISSRAPYIYHYTIAELLTTRADTCPNGMGALARILGGTLGTQEYPTVDPGLEISLEAISIANKRRTAEDYAQNVTILRNLQHIVAFEKSGESVHLKGQPMSGAIQRNASKLLSILFNLINQIVPETESGTPFKFEEKSSEPVEKKPKKDADFMMKEKQRIAEAVKEQIHLIVTLLDDLDIGAKDSLLGMAEILNLAQMTVKYFFWNLTESDSIARCRAMNKCFSLLTKQCSCRKAARTAALRDLLDGALFTYRNLFGAHPNPPPKTNVRFSAIASRISLHAGVIGNGLKTETRATGYPQSEIQKLLLDAIMACCQDNEHTNVIDGFSTVSLLLVEMISPDIMYNGFPWPDEDFTKVTMERDLQIRRIFNNSPILWSILGLVGTYRPALCYASVLLRALCATVLNQWRAKSVEKPFQSVNNPELIFVTLKLLEVMALGQLLPPPLSYLHVVIEYFEPFEVVLLLKDCVWNYMKDHVPSPCLFKFDSTGFHWRNPETAKPPAQFVDPLRFIMLKRLPLLGSLYHQMFVLPEMVNNGGGSEAKTATES
uniref:Putative integrator complex subunit 5-like protein n=1 Tax=Lutzomyia longipalpis TaxID=7200 RepID=A0A1B0CEH9_LUTLO